MVQVRYWWDSGEMGHIIPSGKSQPLSLTLNRVSSAPIRVCCPRKMYGFVYVVEDTRMLIIAGVEPLFMYGMYQISIRYLYLFFYTLLDCSYFLFLPLSLEIKNHTFHT